MTTAAEQLLSDYAKEFLGIPTAYVKYLVPRKHESFQEGYWLFFPGFSGEYLGDRKDVAKWIIQVIEIEIRFKKDALWDYKDR